MSKPASRVIGIIRLAESSQLGMDLSVALDDSTLGSLLASLVGKQSPVGPNYRRWQSLRSALPPRPARHCLRANLAHLRQDLLREYQTLAAH
ncbi:MAG TPA: hypothetical protein VFB96_01875 [Pirellulaceae bacterium]|jgi:hypothetical protein|nr:hypothetical protein [Pirellulaceae bacterium]